jgi:hypothetical protein
MLSESFKSKPSGAEYRKRRAQREHEFEECKKYVNMQKYFTSKRGGNGSCKQSEASTSIPPTDSFELAVTNNDYNVKE